MRAALVVLSCLLVLAACGGGGGGDDDGGFVVPLTLLPVQVTICYDAATQQIGDANVVTTVEFDPVGVALGMILESVKGPLSVQVDTGGGFQQLEENDAVMLPFTPNALDIRVNFTSVAQMTGELRFGFEAGGRSESHTVAVQRVDAPCNAGLPTPPAAGVYATSIRRAFEQFIFQGFLLNGYLLSISGENGWLLYNLTAGQLFKDFTTGTISAASVTYLTLYLTATALNPRAQQADGKEEAMLQIGMGGAFVHPFDPDTQEFDPPYQLTANEIIGAQAYGDGSQFVLADAVTGELHFGAFDADSGRWQIQQTIGRAQFPAGVGSPNSVAVNDTGGIFCTCPRGDGEVGDLVYFADAAAQGTTIGINTGLNPAHVEAFEDVVVVSNFGGGFNGTLSSAVRGADGVYRGVDAFGMEILPGIVVADSPGAFRIAKDAAGNYIVPTGGFNDDRFSITTYGPDGLPATTEAFDVPFPCTQPTDAQFIDGTNLLVILFKDGDTCGFAVVETDVTTVPK